MLRTILMAGVLDLACGFLRAQDSATQYHRVLFVGDSITFHHPAANLGWSGQWGMAASAEDKDYVHLFIAKLTQAQNGLAPIFSIIGEGGGTLKDKVPLASHFTDFHADLAVVQMGENDNTNVNEEGFQRPYENILTAIRAGNPQARILCTGVWGGSGGSPEKNRMIRAVCDKLGATFVDIEAVVSNPANHALAEKRFTNPGVNWHPGDQGMAGYANALWDALASMSAVPIPAPETAAQPVNIVESWTNNSGLAWQPQPPIETEEGHSVVQIIATDPTQHEMLRAPLDTTVLNGHVLVIETRVRGKGISPKPNSENGVKVMLCIGNAEGKYDYPQASLPVGTFGWTPVRLSLRIPDNTVSLALAIGLEKVTGTAYFDTLHITCATDAPPASP